MWVVGATSILGWSVAQSEPGMIPTCSPHRTDALTADWLKLNVEEADAWAPLCADPPAAVIYCAGVCDVERCEAHPDFAWAVNVDGVSRLLDALPRQTRLVLCSSDHVFAGRDAPYVESSEPDATTVYGRTRIAQERLVRERRPDALVVRVALPIGPSGSGKVGHLDWLRYRHARGLPMTVVDGEWRAAVWARDAARRIVALARSTVSGIRHVAATHPAARPELATSLCKRLGIEPAFEVVPRVAPHLGRVDLRTEYADALAAPLASPLD